MACCSSARLATCIKRHRCRHRTRCRELRNGGRSLRTPRLRILHDQRIQIGRAAAARGPDGGNRERHIRPVLAGALRDLGAAHQFERGLAVLRSAVEPGVVERRPAGVAHGIGHPQRRLGRRGGCKLDADLELARRLDRPIRFQPRDLAVDVALLVLRVTDRGIRGRDFLGNGGERRAPLGERTRLAFLAQPRRRGLRKALGEFAARGGGADRVGEIGVFVPQRLDALVEFRQIDRRRGARLLGVDGADGELRARLSLDPQRGRIQRQGEILRHQRVVAGGKIDRHDARDAGAVGINGNGIDRRGDIEIGRPCRHGGEGGNDDQTGG